MNILSLNGGRLREETSGVAKSRAGSQCWGLDPVKEIGQICGSNVDRKRLATSHRNVVRETEARRPSPRSAFRK
jgi:hypothetical protein